MKFSEQWLREWVQPEVNTEELAAQITMAGLEVDSIEPVAKAFSGVVVGQVISREQHPDADKLSVCQVSDGNETFQVVCGAANVRAGLKIPFAKIGAELPGDFKIKKAKLRGVESFGMLCAEAELGLAETSDGLMVLPEDAPVGTDFRAYMGLNDSIIEVDLTPNRGDCLSVAGLAREVGVMNKAAVQGPVINPVAPQIDDKTSIEVLAPSACPRYIGRVVKGINVAAATPLWMVEKLRRSGIRSIDVVVDITNYVMLELGQPMHAFDLKQVQGGIRVRMAEQGEKITLLDGQEITLKSDTLVIADHAKPLAMAGIMGGEHSGVSSDTQDLLLEAAFFDQLAMAGRARNYGLHTDSSHRFERGVDYNLPRIAIERATGLLLELCGGQAGPVVEVSNAAHLPKVASIHLRKARIAQMLTLELADDEVEDMLTRLGMQLEKVTDGWQVTAPSYRFDMAIEPDLIEEVARIYGYNRLPTRTPKAATPLRSAPEHLISVQDIRRQLVARGYQEAITYSFVEPKLQQLLDPAQQPLALANPISAEMSVMRTNLWAGLVAAARHNLNRQQTRIRLFETGLRFIQTPSGLTQQPVISGLICGSRLPKGWSNGQDAVDFFDLKADVEALLALQGGADDYQFAVAKHPALHPGQSASILKDGQEVGLMGALHPAVQAELGLKQTLFVFELEQQAVLTGKLAKFSSLSKFPEVSRDLAFVLEESVTWQQVDAGIREMAGEFLTELTLFDVYRGKGIEFGRKSLALGLTWQAPSRTLNDEEINSWVDAIITKLSDSLGAQLRG